VSSKQRQEGNTQKRNVANKKTFGEADEMRDRKTLPEVGGKSKVAGGVGRPAEEYKGSFSPTCFPTRCCLSRGGRI